MAKYTGELMDDFYEDYNNKLLPYIAENLPWDGMQVYWYVDDIDGEYQLCYGTRQIGSFGDIDLDNDLDIYTFDLSDNAGWLDAEYDWANLSDQEKIDIVRNLVSDNY